MDADTRETILEGIIDRHSIDAARRQIRTWMLMGDNTAGASTVLAYHTNDDEE